VRKYEHKGREKEDQVVQKIVRKRGRRYGSLAQLKIEAKKNRCRVRYGQIETMPQIKTGPE